MPNVTLLGIGLTLEPTAPDLKVGNVGLPHFVRATNIITTL